MADVPVATPVTTPEVPIVATEVVTLLHVPPDVASDKVVVPPTAKKATPVIVPVAGSGFTVTIMVATELPQPFVIV